MMGPGQPEQYNGPRWTIVQSSELAAQPEAGLNARYWVERLPGEAFTAWKVRTEIEELERKAGEYEARAARLRDRAKALRAVQEAEHT
jgi:hypothetical protein